MALKYATTKQFKNDMRRITKREWDTDHLVKVMRQIAKQETLARKYKAHQLTGKYNGFWECHLEPDFLLIWHVKESGVVFVRTGNHSELFGP
jgi:mRNA interferase YafQ